MKGLVCTGFHRSATSATANYLYSAGLELGSNLMPAHISNPKGHFEDSDAVSLHDSFLQKSDTNWQFHDECILQPEIKKINIYAQSRFEKTKQWGVKDPRICLFLDEWDNVLKDQGHYLLIVRHWSSCIESLLHRHSRELAHHMTEANVRDPGFKFWLNPELAARMWLSYNERLLAFARKRRNKVLLVTQRSLFEGAPIISTLNERFGFDLNDNINSPFDKSLLRDQANESIFNSLSYSMREKLNKVHTELLALCDFKSVDETPVFIKTKKVLSTDLLPIHQAIKKIVNEQVYSNSRQEIINVKKISSTDLVKGFALLDIKQTISQLESTNATLLDEGDIDKLEVVIDNKYPLDSDVLLAFAKFLMRIEHYNLAITYFQKTITLGFYFPYFDMLMGQCYQELNLSEKAAFFFDKAIKNNPHNPVFFTSKAVFFIKANQQEQALQTFEQGYELGRKLPTYVLPYCDYLIKIGQQTKAVHLLTKLIDETGSIVAINLLNKLEPSKNLEFNKNIYLSEIQENLSSKNKVTWLAQQCVLISNNASEVDFIGRIYRHWEEIDNAS